MAEKGVGQSPFRETLKKIDKSVRAIMEKLLQGKNIGQLDANSVKIRVKREVAKEMDSSIKGESIAFRSQVNQAISDKIEEVWMDYQP